MTFEIKKAKNIFLSQKILKKVNSTCKDLDFLINRETPFFASPVTQWNVKHIKHTVWQLFSFWKGNQVKSIQVH